MKQAKSAKVSRRKAELSLTTEPPIETSPDYALLCFVNATQILQQAAERRRLRGEWPPKEKGVQS